MDKTKREKEASEGLKDKHVRPAGPEAMEDPPEEWTKTDEEDESDDDEESDEESDESFPASDPPANY